MAGISVARVRSLKRLLSAATRHRMAAEIKAARKKEGLTQADVAEAIGIKQAFFARLESGQSQISIERYLAIAVAIGFDPSKKLKALFAALMHDRGHSARLLSPRRKSDDRTRVAS